MTDTTVIQPGAGQAILTTDHHDDRRGRYGYDDCHRELRSDADYRSLIAQGSVNGDRINSGVQVTGDRITAVGRDAAVAACRTNELVQGGFGGVHDRICDSSKDAALAACKTNDAIGAAFASTQKQVSDAATATVVGFKESQGLAFQVEGRALLEAAKNANAAAVQATMFANAAQLEAQKNAAAAQLEAQKNAAAVALKFCECCHEIQSQADRNFAALQAQADRNTCDLKQLITAEGVATRALANEIEARRVQNELQRLQTQVAILQGGIVGARTA